MDDVNEADISSIIDKIIEYRKARDNLDLDIEALQAEHKELEAVLNDIIQDTQKNISSGRMAAVIDAINLAQTYLAKLEKNHGREKKEWKKRGAYLLGRRSTVGKKQKSILKAFDILDIIKENKKAGKPGFDRYKF